jgi:putative membrane-bound dehydrogenase-like protein
MLLKLYCALVVLTCCVLLAQAAPALLNDYELHPQLEMSLFAREPDVVDPVALTFDEEGRVYVVEMRDYPYGVGPARQSGGTIRLLEDTNNDGKVDRSVLFAEGLSFPTSVAPWKGGILVAAPPEILFLKDTNGDGKADTREVLLKGFTLGVTDSNMNGLRWGLDNRVHGLNGGNGGSIVSTRKPGPPLEIRNLDFSFDPATGDVAPTYHTSAGFGLVFDDWGRSFVTYNINHIQQRMIPVRYLTRFPGFPPVQAVESISDHEEMSRIFPISVPETRVNHPEQSGHFSSAGGMGYIGTHGYPGDLYGSVLVCDVVGNLVHRDVLSPRGPIFVASRSPAEQKSEFFASRDPAFRPVGIELGPDGALYLLDMQRNVIEHPDYIPKKVLEKIDIRAGENRGRIYRITPKGGLPPRTPGLRRASSSELVEWLSSSNQWWRYTAQRLLVERGDTASVPALKKIASGNEPLGRLHALWTLDGLGSLDETAVLRALRDDHPGIRENALLLAERYLPGSKKIQARVLSMADDPDARVRFQTALTLGQIDDPKVSAALWRILQRDHPHLWSRRAALASLGRDEVTLFRRALEESFDLTRELADLIGARDHSSNITAILSILAKLRADSKWLVAALEGLHSGLARSEPGISLDAKGREALEQLSRRDDAVLAAAWKLGRTLKLPTTDIQQQALDAAKQRALDETRPLLSRLDDVRLLALGEFSNVAETLFALLDGSPTAIQLAAVDVLRQFEDAAVARGLIARWHRLAPAARAPVIHLLLLRVSFHEALIEAIENGQLRLGELNLDLEQRRRLMRESTPEIQNRAAHLMGDEEYSNRKAVVEEWLQKLPATGEAARGRAIFERVCAQCHQLDGTGYAVGPDLAALAHRSVEDLLSNILDPNMAINPAYSGYLVETSGGEIETGILKAESADSLELLQALGRKVVFPRKQIKRLEATGLSLMPEGLEAGMTEREMRDLIAYLQAKR